MLGLMMQTPLLLSSILTHAARTFPDIELVSRTPDKPDHRANYALLQKRSSRLAHALIELGVKKKATGLTRLRELTATTGSRRSITPEPDRSCPETGFCARKIRFCEASQFDMAAHSHIPFFRNIA
jgi:hypothetical protein